MKTDSKGIAIRDKNQFTEGSVIKSILLLTFPIIIGNLLQSAYQLTDAFWVGRLGAEAIASVTISFPLMFLIIALSGGIGMGAAVLVSQYKGKGDKEMIDKVTSQALLLAFIVSIIFTILGYLFSPNIISLFGADKNVYDGAVSYLKISFLGLFFIFGYMVYQAIMRGVGDAKTPVYIVLGTVILNLILDPLFIFGWKFIPAYGVAGAAFATVLTQAIALFIGIGLMYIGRSHINFYPKNLKPNRKIIKNIIKLGVPISLEQSSRSIGFLLMSALATSFGTVILAAYGIGMQVIGLVIVVALSLSIANSSLIGQNLGAGKIDRAEKIAKTSAFLGFFSLTFIGLILFIFAPYIIQSFIPSSQIVIEKGTWFIRAVALTFGLVGVNMAFLGAIRGSGNAKTTMKLSLFAVFVQVMSAYILSKYTALGEYGLWLAFPISNIAGMLAATYIIMKGEWKNKNLIEKPEIKEKIKKLPKN
ncbi:MAG: MATE family efflux transporter [Nanoarchaeota archaeon]|nr:MATE family efflux transporter [Nanoarchaeota archaeon]